MLAGAGLCSVALGGPTWPENPEAGALPATAQKVYGPGAVGTIFGSLGGPGPAPIGVRGISGDFQDMYLIKIVDPLAFVATTFPGAGGSANFDTQLFLFTGPDHPAGPGLGIFANDEAPGALAGESLLTNNVTDGSMHPQLLADVHYYLAISGFNSDPVSPTGNIFNQATRTEQSGPDGMGGSDQINAWDANGDVGDYAISLQGVAAQTLCPNSDINNDGVTDTADLGILLANFGAPGGADFNADLNFDGVVDTADLGILLSTFGVVCP
ncbi:MAG: hypothetical protein H6814_07270 [Phycisphaeraceae bacterium]|nr:hypothetical protein [Phycisphaeraceae bacterium]